MSKVRKTKNQLRREKAKLKKKEEGNEENPESNTDTSKNNTVKQGEPPKVESTAEEFVIETVDDPLVSEFQNIFEKFETVEVKEEVDGPNGEIQGQSDSEGDGDSDSGSNSDDSDDSSSEGKTLSKRQLRKLNKVSLVDLKSSTLRPQVVEWFDIDSHDPFLHVMLKSQLNCVPIPSHWTNKRDYLSGRKGLEKLPFQLPKYILDTGIQDLRNVDNEGDSTLRQQQRDRVAPKMGKLDIDYQKLHDAFFKFQTKPRVYQFGDLYYEGRESNDQYTDEVGNSKPGVVSRELRKALGMNENDLKSPPPWIQVMAKIGKPPSYKELFIPGLDIEYSNRGYSTERVIERKIEETDLWGKIGEEDEEEEESEESEEEEDDNEDEENEELDEVVEGDDGEDATKVSISEFGGVKSSSQPNEHSSTKNKPLYQIIAENTAGKSSLTDKGYDITSKRPLEEEEDIVDSMEVPTKKFKF